MTAIPFAADFRGRAKTEAYTCQSAYDRNSVCTRSPTSPTADVSSHVRIAKGSNFPTSLPVFSTHSLTASFAFLVFFALSASGCDFSLTLASSKFSTASPNFSSRRLVSSSLVVKL